MKWLLVGAILFLSIIAKGQERTQADVDSLKNEILKLRTDVDQIQLNLDVSQKKFKKGILVATIGYSVTIAGGLMLGRKYDDAGKVLLVTGGITGITGTFMMVDAFKYLNRKNKRSP
ncbi:MAG: hypothetical protein MUF39_09355 [Cyclobacteriaceae bacterium]|jgi:hypothetical protein|nr:hypothetical protein [Cyclobacteriaceae bacterium]